MYLSSAIQRCLNYHNTLSVKTDAKTDTQNFELLYLKFFFYEWELSTQFDCEHKSYTTDRVQMPNICKLPGAMQ